MPVKRGGRSAVKKIPLSVEKPCPDSLIKGRNPFMEKGTMSCHLKDLMMEKIARYQTM